MAGGAHDAVAAAEPLLCCLGKRVVHCGGPGVTRYSAQVREEPGNLVFSCVASVERPDEYAVIANYADQAAGEAHVASEHVAVVLRLAAFRGRVGPEDGLPGAVGGGLAGDG